MLASLRQPSGCFSQWASATNESRWRFSANGANSVGKPAPSAKIFLLLVGE
jgi:hypothetical protein